VVAPLWYHCGTRAKMYVFEFHSSNNCNNCNMYVLLALAAARMYADWL